MIQISGITNENVKHVAKVEPVKPQKIERNIKPEKTMEFKKFPDKEEEDYTIDEVERAVSSTNRLLNDEHRTQYKFEVHEGTGRVMVNLIDTKTKEVIKEIPPEKILDLVASIWERIGIIVDERG
ncbi:flagellar protein FlaG [Proteiniclasticum sp.]|uniref:flagellar protein FlaG n=1 Tax=Proteiniclasticum sp. TaxID=2053595 RepID=UPI00289D4B54|nr:flagellar protein FlaG [Proteiniclasticum sp.]